MPSQDFWEAAYDLLAEDIVDVVEWSFDMVWDEAPAPDWCEDILTRFSNSGRLLGHGVRLSALSAGRSPRQQGWIENFKRECQSRQYVQISEHFGCAESGSFSQHAPLPVPMTSTAIEIGRQRLQELRQICNVPVGLENLALALGSRDVEEQGTFLRSLLEPVDGFILLDVHNLLCQCVNFNLTPDEILDLYPLELVRELHISGGSVSPSFSGNRNAIRRDTHDGAVPPEAFTLLERALQRCPNVQYVILERLGNTMEPLVEQLLFREDYKQVRSTVEGAWTIKKH